MITYNIMDMNKWRNRFQQLKGMNSKFARNEIRFMRMEIFRSTVQIIKDGEYLSEKKNRKVIDKNDKIIRGTQFYSKEEKVDNVSLKNFDQVNLVENKDCLIVAKKLLDEGYNPLLLNMANRRNPGGGVLNGAGAQEENLFRRTNLFCSLYQYAPYAHLYNLPRALEQYPLDRNFGGVYTPNVLVFRGTESDGYPLLDDPFHVSIVSVAGLCHPKLYEGRIISMQAEGLKNKIRTIFRIALLHGHDSIVLGALGCGAFRNPPEHVAQIFEEVSNEIEFRNHFAVLDFAILEDHNSHCSHNLRGNFQPFYERFVNRDQNYTIHEES